MDETATITSKTLKAKGKVSDKTSKAKTTRKKTTEAKTSPKKTISKKSNTKKEPAKSTTVISIEQRHAMIETAAYLLAEKRGFCGGDPAQDWLNAESDIDATFTQGLQQSESIPH